MLVDKSTSTNDKSVYGGQVTQFFGTSSRGKADYTTHSAESSNNLSLSFYSNKTYRYLLINYVSINSFLIYNVYHCLLEPNGSVRIRKTSRYMYKGVSF